MVNWNNENLSLGDAVLGFIRITTSHTGEETTKLLQNILKEPDFF